ncbi:unnamed protein product [Ectocarpus sp. CCAP 1310/34]|nr:unnamed protein product [Ectocarpus sp. CCAP 1310/34]
MLSLAERVFVDKLGATDASNVLRGAANLPRDGDLCDDALKVLETYGGVAMDIAFVGSWSSVRTPDSCAPKSSWAWTRAVEEIEAQGGGVGVDRDANRLAILRAGFMYLARDYPLAQELYDKLAAFPDRHSFRSQTQLRFWTTKRVDAYAMFNMRKTSEEAGGEGWWVYRPHDEQLIPMEASDASQVHAVHVLAELCCHGEKLGELEAIMRKLLEHYDAHGGGCPEVEMIALYIIPEMLLVGWDAIPSGKQLSAVEVGGGLATSFQGGFAKVELGECAQKAGRLGDAEAWFRQALKIQEANLGGDKVQEGRKIVEAEVFFRRALKIKETTLGPDGFAVAVVLYELVLCVREAGKFAETEALLRRAVHICVYKLRADDLQVSVVLHGLGPCLREAGKFTEAEALFRRGLEIREATLGPGDRMLVVTLNELGGCLRKAGESAGVEAFLRRVLKIKEAKLGPEDVRVGSTLQHRR